ncbi:toprim domain-containing protein [Sansalvadorimonas verongulae]|uniref:hypothetical protein n=1 Tax=Sansalvadorimonas verongulae TaxID=2172824 RepID=UPI0012BC9FD7|nr:hypothetical protein [Sansalvadorimonas verongulae]
MKSAFEYLLAIHEGRPVHWVKCCRLLTNKTHGLKPGQLSRIFSPRSDYEATTVVDILDQDAFDVLRERFPEPVLVVDRPSASMAGNSHGKPVSGSLLNIYRPDWAEPRTAVSWDGAVWSPEPEQDIHLLLVENLENFLRPRETLELTIQQCGLTVNADKILLVYGSGNAASKACNGLYYRQFLSVNCLFDLDVGGLGIYENIKAMPELQSHTLRFLVPDNVQARLQASRWKLTASERTKIFQAQSAHPELSELLRVMYTSHKKLEQETYLNG